MRLIDADAFKEYLRKGAETNADIIPQRLVDAVLDIMDGIMLDIDEQPTVDAVPVEVVADMFGEVPCNYAFCARQGDGFIQVDDFMYEQCDGWCEDKCGEVPTIECWKRFFKAWVERRDDE